MAAPTTELPSRDFAVLIGSAGTSVPLAPAEVHVFLMCGAPDVGLFLCQRVLNMQSCEKEEGIRSPSEILC